MEHDIFPTPYERTQLKYTYTLVCLKDDLVRPVQILTVYALMYVT